LLCYGFTLATNIYSIFVVALGLIMLGTTNIYIFLLVEAATAVIPLTYYYLEDDYVLLNMLTYFPYPESTSFY
jgi:hypothetical protein